MLCLASFFSVCSNAQTVSTEHGISDDGYANVPLQFDFPFYGQSFNNSWMFSNGLVTFVDPTQSGMAGSNLSVQPFSTTMGSSFNYSIYALWTDLINISGTFRTEGSTEFQRYSWIGISPYYDQNRLNTFSVEIRPDGKIITNYSLIDANYAGVGLTGNTANGEFEQIAYHQGAITNGSISNWERYTQAVDICSTNPLSSSTCPGYAQAYYDQQCSNNALYDSGCTGYEQAYFTQQCTISPLYNQNCPGYAEAYFNQQCTSNPLYNNRCPGYAQAKALKDLQEQSTVAETSAVPSPSITIVESSSPTVALADPTRTETVVTTDVGGVELTVSGQISIPTGQPTATKEAIKEATAEKKEEKKTVNTRALAAARAASKEAEQTALATASDAVMVSQLDPTSAALGFGLGVNLQGNRGQGNTDNESQSTTGSQGKNQTTDLQGRSSTAVQDQEVQQKNGPAVRNGGKVEGMEGGPDPTQLTRVPMDFNQYLQSQLQDSQFYASKEIYKGQRTVDNARAERFLNGKSDVLHQRMIEQQYNIGN